MHKVGLQTLFIIYTLFKERFPLGQVHPAQHWARNMRLQLLQNLKQEENNNGAPILQFEMMENEWYEMGLCAASVATEQLSLELWGLIVINICSPETWRK